MCQWIHSYSLEETDFFSIVKTFGSVFPHMELWCVNRHDFLLIGTDAPIHMDIQALRARMTQKNVKPLLESIRFDAEEELIACFMSTDAELRGITKDAAMHTDDNMRLEFSAPKALYNAVQLMRSTQFEPDPESIVDLTPLSPDERAKMEILLDTAASGREHTRCAFEHAGNRIDHWVKALKLAPKQFWAVEYQKFIEEAVAKRPPEPTPKKPDAELERVKQIAERDGLQQALAELQKIGAQRQAAGVTTLESPELAVQLMRSFGAKADAEHTLLTILEGPGMLENPNAARLWMDAAELSLESEKPDVQGSIGIARRADTLARKNGDALDAVGRIWLKTKNYVEAYNEYRFLCATNPRKEEFNYRLADTFAGCCRRSEAARRTSRTCVTKTALRPACEPRIGHFPRQRSRCVGASRSSES